jgi:hypothetical protein
VFRFGNTPVSSDPYPLSSDLGDDDQGGVQDQRIARKTKPTKIRQKTAAKRLQLSIQIWKLSASWPCASTSGESSHHMDHAFTTLDLQFGSS